MLTKLGVSTTPRPMKAPVPDIGSGNGAEAGFPETVLAPALEFERHLVPPVAAARPVEQLVVIEPEAEQHRLLQPLIDRPVARRLLVGDARLAAVEQFERRVHRIADRPFGRGSDLGPRLPGVIDGLFERSIVGHGEVSPI